MLPAPGSATSMAPAAARPSCGSDRNRSTERRLPPSGEAKGLSCQTWTLQTGSSRLLQTSSDPAATIWLQPLPSAANSYLQEVAKLTAFTGKEGEKVFLSFPCSLLLVLKPPRILFKPQWPKLFLASRESHLVLADTQPPATGHYRGMLHVTDHRLLMHTYTWGAAGTPLPPVSPSSPSASVPGAVGHCLSKLWRALGGTRHVSSCSQHRSWAPWRLWAHSGKR